MHQVRNPIREIRRFVTGEDVFISYAREDGTVYATGLANQLSDAKFSCLFDQWSASPGKKIPAGFRRAIRNSSLCVLVCTKEAAKSENIADEIKEFLMTGRTIIPIDPADYARKAVWWPLVEGLKWEPEEASALVTGTPSPAVLRRIDRSCTFATKDRRLKRSARA